MKILYVLIFNFNLLFSYDSNFINEILTYGQLANQEIIEEGIFLKESLNYNKKDDKTNKIMKKYGIKKLTKQQIENRVQPINLKIMVSQAIIESNSGKSRYAKEGNNLFGIWTTNSKKGISISDNNKFYIEKFDNKYNSVKKYAEVLNSSMFMKEFREIRKETSDEYKMVSGLKYYSQEREEYVKKIVKIMKVIEKKYF